MSAPLHVVAAASDSSSEDDDDATIAYETEMQNGQPAALSQTWSSRSLAQPLGELTIHRSALPDVSFKSSHARPEPVKSITATCCCKNSFGRSQPHGAQLTIMPMGLPWYMLLVNCCTSCSLHTVHVVADNPSGLCYVAHFSTSTCQSALNCHMSDCVLHVCNMPLLAWVEVVAVN